MIKSFLLSALASLCFLGCGSISAPVSPLDPVITAVTVADTVAAMSNAHVRAVCVGLTKVNPAAYGGWAGELPDTDLDAKAMYSLFTSKGFPTLLLLDEQATKAGVTAACTLAAQGLKPDSLLILYISGHGGQVPDGNGDEADGKDDTLCLYDGQLSDDVVWTLLCKLPKGVRVLFITDTCNSGTNYRAPHIYGRPWYRFGDFEGSLLHWGGCGDGESSMSTGDGGAFTIAIRGAYAGGVSTYDDWFQKAKAMTRPGQVPTMREEGSGPSFKDREALK